MLHLLVTRGGTIHSVRNVNNLVVFVGDEAGHPKPLLTVNGLGQVHGPVKASERSDAGDEKDKEDFYSSLDSMEKAIFDAL